MEKTEFQEKVKKALEDYAGEDHKVHIKQVRKNNGIRLTGVSLFKEDSNITPTIYLEDYHRRYENGETFGSIMREIIHLIEQSEVEKHFDVNAFTEWKRARKRLAYRLIHAEKNRELLEDVPHVLFLDMAMVFYYLLGEEEFGNASILIYRRHMEQWGVTEEELYTEAHSNTRHLLPERLQCMQDLMRDILMQDLSSRMEEEGCLDHHNGEELQELADEMLSSISEGSEMVEMYVLTNHLKYFGAACMLYPGILKSFSEEIGKNLYILPSSVHELILLGDNGHESAEQLRTMVMEVNSTQVAPDEVLSDSVYYYDHNEDKLSIIRCSAAVRDA